MEINWLILSIIALVLWGIWGFFAKLASNYLNWKQVYVIVGFTAFLVYLSFYFWFRPEIKIGQQGFIYALLTGIFGPLGGIAFYSAISQGKISLILPLTALYPIITIILAFLILQERITLLQGLGIIFAITSLVLLSIS